QIDARDTNLDLIIDPRIVFSSYRGGESFDFGRALAVDAQGDLYLTGSTWSLNFPTRNPYQGSRKGSIDAFVTKMRGDGTDVVYSTYLGGSTDQYPGYDDGPFNHGMAIAVDTGGYAYVTGKTNTTNFPVTNGAFQTSFQGGGNYNDVFVTKLSQAGNALV